MVGLLLTLISVLFAILVMRVAYLARQDTIQEIAFMIPPASGPHGSLCLISTKGGSKSTNVVGDWYNFLKDQMSGDPSLRVIVFEATRKDKGRYKIKYLANSFMFSKFQITDLATNKIFEVTICQHFVNKHMLELSEHYFNIKDILHNYSLEKWERYCYVRLNPGE